MHGEAETGLDFGRLLRAVDEAPPVMAVDVMAGHLAAAFGASMVAFSIADFSGRALTRLSHDSAQGADKRQGRESGERVPLAGTPHGRVLAAQKVEVEPHEDGVHVYAPVTNRGEAIGILELTLPDVPDAQRVAEVTAAAHVLAYIVIANRRFTDLYDWGQRSVPLTVPAEVQHRLLPGSFTCEAGQFTIAAWLEPAGEVAGDTFDFTVERDTLHVSVTDAMGHGVEASVLATLLVGALRNGRRAGVDLAGQARLADEELGRYVELKDGFVTGQLARIDLRTGNASIVNAGHPAPLRLRDGRVEPVVLRPDPPFGAAVGGGYGVQALPLAQGDRLVFLTDGMIERNAADLDIQALIAHSAGMHAREAVQYLTHAVLQAAHGRLQDDATVLCLDWYGPAIHEAAPSADTNAGRQPHPLDAPRATGTVGAMRPWARSGAASSQTLGTQEAPRIQRGAATQQERRSGWITDAIHAAHVRTRGPAGHGSG